MINTRMIKKTVFVCLFVIGLLLVHPAMSFAGPYDDALAYLNFEEGSGTTTANSGTAGNSLYLNNMDPGTDWVAGKIGNYALDFDGTNDWLNGENVSLNLNNAVGMTASAWIKPDILTGEQVIAGANGPFIFSLNGSKLGHPTRAIYNWTWSGATGATDLVTGNWYHVVMTYDGTNIKLYLDGVEDGFAAKTGNLVSSFNLTIGAMSSMGGGQGADMSWFNGLLDEVAIWNRALDTSEISTLYNNGAGYDPVGACVPELPPFAMQVIAAALTIFLGQFRRVNVTTAVRGKRFPHCHSREGGNLGPLWIPAFAGMTRKE